MSCGEISARQQISMTNRNMMSTFLARSTGLIFLLLVFVSASFGQNYSELMNQGDNAVRAQNYAAAVDFYTRALNIQSTDPDLFVRRANALVGLRRFAPAIDDYTSALNLRRGDSQILFNRAIAYMESGGFDEAIADLDEILKHEPNDDNSLVLRGMANVASGRYYQAIIDFNKALKLRPNDTEILVRRGDAFYDMGNYDGAIKDYSKAIDANPRNPDAYFNRANAHYMLSNYNSSIADFTKVLELTPDAWDAMYSRANAYMDLKQFRQGLIDFNALEKVGFNDPQLYFNRALAHYHLQEYDDAIADLTEFMKREPKASYALFHRADAKAAKGDMKGAEADLLACLNSDKFDVPAKVKVRQRMREMGLKPPPDPMATFEHSSGDFAVRLPQSWYTRTSESGGTTYFSASETEVNEDEGIQLVVGVNLAMLRDVPLNEPSQPQLKILEFGSQLVQNVDPDSVVSNKVLKESRVEVSNYAGIRRDILFQEKPEDKPVRMLQVILASTKNLVIATYEAPEAVFEQYKGMFEESVRTLTLK